MEKGRETNQGVDLDAKYKVRFWEDFSRRLLIERDLLRKELSEPSPPQHLSIRRKTIQKSRAKAEETLAFLDNFKNHLKEIDLCVRETHHHIGLWSLYRTRIVTDLNIPKEDLPILPWPRGGWVFRFPFSLLVCFSESFSSFDPVFDVFVSDVKAYDGLTMRSRFLAYDPTKNIHIVHEVEQLF